MSTSVSDHQVSKMVRLKKPSLSTISSTDNLVEVSTRRRLFYRKKKKLALLLILILAILSFLFMVLFVAYNFKYVNLLNEKICTSRDCVETASTFLGIMDLNEDPCQDFFAYACGNFDQEHPVPDGGFYNSWFEEGDNRLSRMVNQILEETNQRTTSASLNKTHRFYQSCINTDLIEAYGLQPLYETLEKVGLPKFPTKESAENFNLGKTLGLLQRHLQLDMFIQMSLKQGQLQPDGPNDTFIIKLSPFARPLQAVFHGISLADLASFGSHSSEAIRKDSSSMELAVAMTAEQFLVQQILFITGIMDIILGNIDDENSLERNSTELITEAYDIIKFSRNLNKLLEKYKNETEEQGTLMTLAILQTVLEDSSPSQKPSQKIIWKDYLSATFSGEKGYWTYNYEEDFVNIDDIEAFKIISNFLGTSRALSIQRFVWWVVVKEYAQYTTKEMNNVYKQFWDSILGESRQRSRNLACVAYIRKFFNFPLAKQIKDVFGLANHTQKVIEMLEDIKEEFESLVYGLNWMDLPTKLININKAKAVENYIGYEDEVLDQRLIDKYYADLTITSDEFFKNMVGIKEWETQKVLRVLRQSNISVVGPLLDKTDPLQVNAFYGRTTNAIYVPAGILQKPFYFRGLESLNYGAIGSILGHELTHGFDYDGKNFDKHGKHQKDNWRPQVTKNFEHRAECFIHQYSKFNLTRTKRLNGRLTLSENIADNGGLRESFYAYQTFVKRYGPEPKLPGFEQFSAEQLLFISYATTWCESRTSKYINQEDAHSPNRVRVLGTLQNMKEFADAFNCPKQTFMNPDNKCILW